MRPYAQAPPVSDASHGGMKSKGDANERAVRRKVCLDSYWPAKHHRTAMAQGMSGRLGRNSEGTERAWAYSHSIPNMYFADDGCGRAIRSRAHAPEL